MRVIHPSAVPGDHLVADAGFMGAPTVGIEKLDSDQAEAAVHTVLEAYRSLAATPRDESGATGQPSGAPASQQESSAGSLDGKVREGAAAAAASSPPCRLAALLAGEVGGGNGVEPLACGARLGLPVVDGDLMGRAFPELQASAWSTFACLPGFARPAR
jgi:DUF917 family protein